ncbi:hypothetical protein Hypma_004408 [Hypsizygus marmoreus]|uniref:Uncharacterized protein n=1 Tax=Hypsizygus marmoreus TaxID=39966 RepID=A0A369K8S8_HYPMA|nr:hypothetical protein Hypma_004408 [Hypsizygus marmoreus]
MVFRVAGYKLTREEARKWALKTGGYEYNTEDGDWEAAVIMKWFKYTQGMGDVFPDVRYYQWPQPTLPRDKGSNLVVFMERRRAVDSQEELVENREDIFIKQWLLDNGLRGIVTDLNFLVIDDPNLTEFQAKHGAPPPKSPETIAFMSRHFKKLRFRFPKQNEIQPLNSQDLFAKLDAAKAAWKVQDQQKDL